MNRKEQPFYGAVTVGERGQVVIPVSARNRFGIRPGDKLLVFGVPGGGVALFKVESISRFISAAMDRLTSMEKALYQGAEPPPEPAPEEGPPARTKTDRTWPAP